MKRLSLLLFVLFSVMSINAQQWHTTIEILTPAKIKLPEDVKDILLVNNTVPQPNDLGHSLIVDGKQLSNQEADLSTAPLHLLVSTSNEMSANPLLRSVSSLTDSQNKSGSFYTKKFISTSQAAQLCKDYMVDALLVLDQLVIYDIEEAYSVSGKSSEVELTDEAYLNSSWSIYQGNKQPVHFQVSDTLVADEGTISFLQLLRDESRRQALLLEMSAMFSETVAKTFVPQWEKVDRYLYDEKDKNIRQGIEYFRRQQWQAAIDEWTLAIGAKKKRTRAYAAANIAVAHEILGNFDEAVSWTNTAIDIWKTVNNSTALQQQVNLKYYIKQLQKRKDFQF